MPNIAGNDGRIDPPQIVTVNVRETPVILWTLRLMLGLAAAFIVLVFTAASMGLWSLIPAVTLSALVIWKANGRRILQIGAEFLPDPSVPDSPRPRNTERVSAISLQAGDWVCSEKTYKGILADLQLAQERTASGQAEAGQSQESGGQPAEDPVIPLRRVIVMAESPDQKNLQLIFADKDREEPARGEVYYRHRPKGKRVPSQPVQEASEALSRLLIFLAMGKVSESDLISELMISYPEPSVHRALRAALAQQLVEQEIFGRLFRELCAVFSRKIDEGLRRKCLLSLSEAGTLWVEGGNALWHDKENREKGKSNFMPGTVNIIITDSRASVHDRTTSSSSNDQPHEAEAENQVTKTPDDGSGAGVASLSGTVAGASAAIAALINRGALWGRAVFISFVIVSVCTFVIAIFAFAPIVVSWWQEQHSASPKGDISAGPDA